MRIHWYQAFRFLGIWAVAVLAWVVSTGYFLFRYQRVAASMRVYRRLFPERGRFFHLLCVWRQFHNFASLFSERLYLEAGKEVEIQSEGWQHLEAAAEGGSGGIIVMSHMGNWELAARLFRRRRLKMMLFMGARKDEKVEKVQKTDLTADRVQVIAARQGTGSPLDALEGLRHLRSGGFISMAGDRVGYADQRCVPVQFLGREVMLPQAAYEFAMISGAPLFVFFVLRTGKKEYRIQISEPEILKKPPRAERGQVIAQAAQRYARRLEEELRHHPFQWYHFGESNIHRAL